MSRGCPAPPAKTHIWNSTLPASSSGKTGLWVPCLCLNQLGFPALELWLLAEGRAAEKQLTETTCSRLGQGQACSSDWRAVPRGLGERVVLSQSGWLRPTVVLESEQPARRPCPVVLCRADSKPSGCLTRKDILPQSYTQPPHHPKGLHSLSASVLVPTANCVPLPTHCEDA